VACRHIRTRANAANRRAGIESIIDADPVAACVREIMAERSSWMGSAADFLRAGADRNSAGISSDRMGWPKNPRALAGRLRRAQRFLRTLGIEITFTREGRAANRIIRMRAKREVPSAPSVSSATVDPGAGRPPPPAAGDVCDDNCRLGLVGPPRVGHVSVTADGTDENAAVRGGGDALEVRAQFDGPNVGAAR
jgi:hypothetical protein